MKHAARVQEILVANGLDFHINKVALQGISGEPTPYFGLFNSKTNECINTAKAGYTVSQNDEVMNMVLTGTERFGELSVHKAGSINGGRRIFIQLKVDGAALVGTDTITKFITIIDSNDGSTGLSVGIGDIAAHCFNQFFRFYKAGEAKFRHTATLEQKMLTIPSLVETAMGRSMQQIALYKKWLSTPLTKDLADKMVHSVLGYDRVLTNAEDRAKLSTRSIGLMDTLYTAIETERGMVGDNLFGLFNGVTRFTTHHQKVPKRTNGHDESLMVGEAYNKAIKAFDFCVANS